MMSKETAGIFRSRLEAVAADGWANYHLAHTLLEQAANARALALLAQAETIFRTCDDMQGLWRALIGQAQLHWNDGMFALAEARALAALHAAEDTDDGFAVGCVSWQLAAIKIGQDDYAQAADYLDQAQLALDAIGFAPPGGLIAAAAQLCLEIMRWRQLLERRQIDASDAEAVIDELRTDLATRLQQVAASLRLVTTPAGEFERGTGERPGLPAAVLLPQPPGLARTGLSAWLTRLWRQLIYGNTMAERRMAYGPVAEVYDWSAARVAGAPELPRRGPELACGDDVREPPIDTTPADLPPEPGDGPAAELITPAAPPPAPYEQPEASSAELTGIAAHNEPPAGPTLVVQMLGGFRVTFHECSVESWPSGRGRAVFKYLLAHRDRPTPRDVLMETFWPDASADSARNSLNVALYGLRQALRAATDVPVVIFQNGAYRLNPALQIWLDIEEFKRCVQSGRRSEDAGDLAGAIGKYQQAAALYQGDFMSDDLGDDWPVLPRERLRIDYLDTLDRLSHMSFANEQYAACITLCQMILAQDNCREDVHCRLIRCYSRQDQYHLALRQYQACLEALDAELGVAPAPATTQLYERIRRHEVV